MAQELVRRGWYLGFDGPVTYKNNRKAGEVLAVTPLERILAETDSPYMAPVPYRGRRQRLLPAGAHCGVPGGVEGGQPGRDGPDHPGERLPAVFHSAGLIFGGPGIRRRPPGIWKAGTRSFCSGSPAGSGWAAYGRTSVHILLSVCPVGKDGRQLRQKQPGPGAWGVGLSRNRGGAQTGSITRTRVPSPGRLWITMAPPWSRQCLGPRTGPCRRPDGQMARFGTGWRRDTPAGCRECRCRCRPCPGKPSCPGNGVPR